MALKVMIIQSQKDVLGQVVETAIIDAPDFELAEDRVVAIENMGLALETHGATLDVLIAIGDGLPVRTVLAWYPSLIVSHIVIGPDAVHLDLKHVGLDQLLSTLRLLHRKEDDRAAGCALEYHIASRPGQAADDACEVVPAGMKVTTAMTKALRWVDALLLLYHQQNPPAEGDIPGLSRGGRLPIEAMVKPAAAEQALRLDAARAALLEADKALRAELERVGGSEPLGALLHNLSLSFLELQAILLCLAPELDLRYQAAYGMLHDDLGRRSATLGLICALLGEAELVRAELSRTQGLVRWRLIEQATALPHADEPLRLEPELIAWLLGEHDALAADGRLRRMVRVAPWPGAGWAREPERAQMPQQLGRLLAETVAEDRVVLLTGDGADRWRADLEAGATTVGKPLLRIVLGAASEGNAEEIGIRIARLAQVQAAVPVVDLSEMEPGATPSDGVARLSVAIQERVPQTMVIAPDGEWLLGAIGARRCLLLRNQRLDRRATGVSYVAAAAEAGLAITAEEGARLALTFELSLGGVAAAARLAAMEKPAAELEGRAFPRLVAACRRTASPDLPKFTQRIEPAFSLDDVVLPAERKAQLREMIGHVLHAPRVLNDWGFGAQLPYGRGVAALLSGSSGTGKTMAAHAAARALDAVLYVVDISQVASKYVGEMEKNIDVVFTEAERAGAVLLFDEADAFFSKRSEVKDAHDRYANMEVAYLLQRMESFAGLAILTTNFRQNIDQAFLRRLRFVIEFPRPGVEAREAIWRRCFPQDMRQDSAIDFAFLARQLDITGGNIRQILVGAAFAAAAENAPAIEMRHIVAASGAELTKLGKQSTAREFAEYENYRRQSANAA